MRPLLTIRSTAKASPPWQFIMGGVIGIAGCAFYGWIVRTALGWNPSVVRQAVVSGWVIWLVFIPILYAAYRRRLRERNAQAVPRAMAGFASMSYVWVLYFMNKAGTFGSDPTVKWLTIGTSATAFAVGVLLMIIGVKYELE